MSERRKSERSTRRNLSSPGRPPVWQREHLCRFWQEIAAGLSSEEAAVAAGVSAPVGTRWFRSSGGMPPTHLAPSAPVPKHRSLSFVEREEIALECARGTGVRAIARKLGRSPSTISREIRRNSSTRSGEFDYRATAAQWHADRASRRPKASKLALNPALRDDVQDRLSGLIATPDGIAFDGPVVVWKGRRAVLRQSRRWSSAWSPEQISQRLKVDFPEDPTMRISHEGIYQALFIQGREALRRELSACRTRPRRMVAQSSQRRYLRSWRGLSGGSSRRLGGSGFTRSFRRHPVCTDSGTRSVRGRHGGHLGAWQGQRFEVERLSKENRLLQEANDVPHRAALAFAQTDGSAPCPPATRRGAPTLRRASRSDRRGVPRSKAGLRPSPASMPDPVPCRSGADIFSAGYRTRRRTATLARPWRSWHRETGPTGSRDSARS